MFGGAWFYRFRLMIPYQTFNSNVGGTDTVGVFIQRRNELLRLTVQDLYRRYQCYILSISSWHSSRTSKARPKRKLIALSGMTGFLYWLIVTACLTLALCKARSTAGDLSCHLVCHNEAQFGKRMNTHYVPCRAPSHDCKVWSTRRVSHSEGLNDCWKYMVSAVLIAT